MAKQKVVLKLSIDNAKNRAKAMQCAVGVHGVVSVSIEEDKMIVVGNGVDSVTLTTLLRKKMGYVELVTVTEVKETNDEKKQETKEVKMEAAEAKSINQPLIWSCYYGQPVGNIVQPLYHHENIIEPDYDQNNCCIM